MTQGSTHLKFKKCYTFPESVEKNIWDSLVDLADRLERPIDVLHAPSGVSRIGHVEPFIDDRIKVTSFDIDPSTHPNILGDIFNISKNEIVKMIVEKIGGFDSVVSDPIWIEEKRCRCVNCNQMTPYKNPKGLAYHKRRYVSYELRDVLKKGGLFIMNCLWNPWVIGLSREPIVGAQLDYKELDGLEDITTVQTIYQAFSSFRNVSLIWKFTKE